MCRPAATLWWAAPQNPPSPALPARRQPFTIPLDQGPVSPATDRAFAVLALTAAIVAVVVLLPLAPDERGFDTHVQLGMERCGWPRTYGIPCPACGCTTAACLVVHGRLLTAFVTQPFGAALAVSGLLLGAHGLYCLLRGRSFVDLLVRLPFWTVLFCALLLLLAAWAYKCAVFQA